MFFFIASHFLPRFLQMLTYSILGDQYAENECHVMNIFTISSSKIIKALSSRASDFFFDKKTQYLLLIHVDSSV